MMTHTDEHTESAAGTVSIKIESQEWGELMTKLTWSLQLCLKFSQGQKFPGSQSSHLEDRAQEANLTPGEEEINRRSHRNGRKDCRARAPEGEAEGPGSLDWGSQ